jgi:hypothetical protein
MPAKRPSPLQSLLPVIATIFVVGGVALIVRLAPSRNTNQELDYASGPASESEIPETVVVIQSGSRLAINVKKETTRQTTCDLPNGFVTVDRVTDEGIAIRSATGGHMLLNFSCSALASSNTVVPALPSSIAAVSASPVVIVAGIPNSAGTRGAWLGSPKSDGAGTLRISDGKNVEEIVLRGKKSLAYRDAEIIGWIDDDHVALSALQGDARHIVLVEPLGRVNELVQVPEEAAAFSVGAGSVWYVTVTPGQGIESGPTGPSEVHRVSLNGEDRVAAHEEDVQAIESLTVRPNVPADPLPFAYRVGDRLIWSDASGTRTDLGSARALGWSADGGLIVARDRMIVSILTSGIRELNVPADADAAAAWVITGHLDEAVLGQ